MKKNFNTRSIIKNISIGFAIGIAVILLIVFMVSRESCQRHFKDIKSDYTGGLNRTVTVYDFNGNKIEEYKGKFDVEYKADGSVKFDIDGKRTVVTGGIIINQEE